MNGVFRFVTSRAGFVLIVLSLAFGACDSSDKSGEAAADTKQSAPIVVVLNGCGVSGAARLVADGVRSIGFDVGNGHGENADSFDYPNTLVVDMTGDMETARIIGEQLGATIIQQISHDPDRFGSVAVIVGADYRARLAELHEE